MNNDTTVKIINNFHYDVESLGDVRSRTPQNHIRLTSFGSASTDSYHIVGSSFYFKKKIYSEETTLSKLVYNHLFSNCEFSNMYVCGVSFIDCIFTNCSFENITLVSCEFMRCEFRNCSTTFRSFNNIESVLFFRTGILYSDIRFNNAAFTEIVSSTISYSKISLQGPIVVQNVIGAFTTAYKSELHMIGSVHPRKIGPSIFIEEDAELDKEAMSRLLFSASKWNYDIEFENRPYIPMACPDRGSFVGYKAAVGVTKGFQKAIPVIIKIAIPDDALRSSSVGRKCRCNKAYILDFYDPETHANITNNIDYAFSYIDNNFVYKWHDSIYPDMFDFDRWAECSNGIHFFMNFEEAVEYIK